MRGLVVLALVAACGGRGLSPDECRDGETRSCYQGLASTENVGACKSGVETCSGGKWPGVCLGDVTPFVESCNGIDDDCDGIVDNARNAGETCTAANGCTGQRACGAGGALVCVAPAENECGLCDGPPVDGLGGSCSDGGCPGTLVCGSDQTSVVCNAPAQNECEVCGGPAVPDLGTVCMAAIGCAGRLVCSATGTTSVCDCSVNICDDNGTIRDIVPPGVGDLVISEVMPSPSAVSDTVGEWFEVVVMNDVDLNNLGLDRAGDTANPNVLRAYSCQRVTTGTRLVFARNADPAMNGGIPASAIAGTFTFSLIAGSVATPGDVRLVFGATVIDAITWTASTSGASLQLDPDATDAVMNDNPANFCTGRTPYGAGDLGTPGGANVECLAAGECLDNGTPRAIVPPPAGQLVISEVMPNPITEPAQEWFEVVNIGPTAFDLNGVGIDRADDTAAPNVIASTACIELAADAYAVFARSTDPGVNGGLPGVTATFTFQMTNSNNSVSVVDAASCATTTPFACTTIYDTVSWTTTSDGVSRQVMPGNLTTTENDSAANFCPGITMYGTANNLGSPGVANACM